MVNGTVDAPFPAKVTCIHGGAMVPVTSTVWSASRRSVNVTLFTRPETPPDSASVSDTAISKPGVVHSGGSQARSGTGVGEGVAAIDARPLEDEGCAGAPPPQAATTATIRIHSEPYTPTRVMRASQRR